MFLYDSAYYFHAVLRRISGLLLFFETEVCFVLFYPIERLDSDQASQAHWSDKLAKKRLDVAIEFLSLAKRLLGSAGRGFGGRISGSRYFVHFKTSVGVDVLRFQAVIPARYHPLTCAFLKHSVSLSERRAVHNEVIECGVGQGAETAHIAVGARAAARGPDEYMYFVMVRNKAQWRQPGFQCALALD